MICHYSDPFYDSDKKQVIQKLGMLVLKLNLFASYHERKEALMILLQQSLRESLHSLLFRFI